MIVIVWVLAFAVSCPLLFGFNTTGRSLPKTIACREGLEMKLPCVRPGHLMWVLQTFQVIGNFRELESTL